MLIKRLALLALLLCSATGANGTVRAGEAFERNAEDALSARIDQLQAEIAALRQQPGSYLGGGGEGCGCATDCGGAPACCCQDDCCAGCWHAPCCSCGFYGGGEVLWAQPRWRGFDAVTVSSASSGGPLVSNTQGFDYDYDPTARFFVGYTGCNGLGVRASWWEFDHDADSITVTVPAVAGGSFFRVFGPLGVDLITFGTGPDPVGSTFVANQSLELQTLDFEATSCFQACGGNAVVAFGLRYAKYDVRTQEAAFDPAGALIEAADFRESFEGWGPTVGLEFVRPLCFSGFSLYSSLRGSVLVGEEHQTARFFVGSTGALFNLASREANEPLGIAELQIALQWCHCGWFARGGWQAQYWDDIAGDPPPPGFVGGGGGPASNSRADLSVQGFFFTVGAQY